MKERFQWIGIAIGAFIFFPLVIPILLYDAYSDKIEFRKTLPHK
jgi:hypothetical protein